MGASRITRLSYRVNDSQRACAARQVVSARIVFALPRSASRDERGPRQFAVQGRASVRPHRRRRSCPSDWFHVVLVLVEPRPHEPPTTDPTNDGHVATFNPLRGCCTRADVPLFRIAGLADDLDALVARSEP